MAAFAYVGACLMIAQQVGGKATRDALFLSRFPATELPFVVIATAALSLLAAAMLSRLVARRGPGRVVPIAFLLSAVAFVAEWAVLRSKPDWVAVAVYLHVGAGSAVLISGFWTVASERFESHSAKPTIARIAAFSALGGAAGGLVAERVSVVLGVPAMLLVLGIAHAGCAFAVGGLDGDSGTSARPPALTASAVSLLRSRAYLQMMALLVCLLAVVDTLLDYALKSEAALRLGDAESLARFFAIFYTGTSLFAFGLQAGLGPRIIARLGLSGSIALRPASVVVAGALAAGFANLWTIAALRAGEFVMANSLFRSGFELLYAPIATATKRPTKTTIDVGGQRLGDLLGGTLVLGLLWIAPNGAAAVVILTAVAVAVGALLVVRRLGRLHLRELGRSLRAGLLSIEDSTLDPVTRRMVRTIAFDRSALRARIRRAQAEDPVLIPNVVGLSTGPHAGEAKQYLREAGPRATRQLVALLLDGKHSVRNRREIAAALATVSTRTALDGLVLGLGEPEFDVRLACARAAVGITTRVPGLAPDPKMIYGILRRELRAGRSVIESRARAEHDAEESVLLETASTASVPVGIEYLFTLLALVLGPEMIGSVLRGLYCGDRKLKGTAMEYLHAALPEAERQMLWPVLSGAANPTESVRARA